MALLETANLKVSFTLDDHDAKLTAVDEVSFELDSGQTLGIVGESGSGKTTLALSLMGLVDGAGLVSGNIRFRGQELTSLKEKEWKTLRWFSLAKKVADHFLVMLEGIIVEEGTAAQVLESSEHWYTEQLLAGKATPNNKANRPQAAYSVVQSDTGGV